ncbi:MAG: primosomal protein N' [Spirochaetes bacterium]|nr:primosomal protein N' [Spirochaetota bacterium]
MSAYAQVAFDIPVDRVFTYRVDPGTEVRVGVRVEAPFGRRELTGFVTGLADSTDVPEAGVKTIRRVVDAEPLFDEGTISLARWVAGMYFCAFGEALSAMLPTGRREIEAPALPLDDEPPGSTPLELSDEQRKAMERVLSAPDGTRYLFGMTGSGKTEVFLQVAEATLAEGRGVIYLVPEIALTRQVTEAVTRRFGSRCAIIHSRLTPSQKLSEWRRILRGEADVVVGARSAIFAPVRNLGLVVLDEEHEGTYKAGSSPRYHARQVAMRRCTEAKARLLMGSATPSAESFLLMRDGRIERLDLTKRLAGGKLPEIEVVDMKQEGGAISRRLAEAMRAAKDAGGQTVLFLNRRGFSFFFRCGSCGAELTCRHCSVPLTFHKERGRVVCHYCGYSAPPPSACPECGSLDVGWAGFGTERVEEDVARLFPDMTVARLDADSAAKRGALETILDDFRAGRVDVLLGTQMVAKGLNFPGVKLVGVVLADTSLNLPDFRAAERTFSLVTQVAGRAGRFTPDGRVIVQTFRPRSPVVRFAAAHDIEGFYASELAAREELGFPPFARLVRIVFRSKDGARAVEASKAFAEAAAAFAPAGTEVLGPAECPIGMVAGNTRMQVVLRSVDPNGARTAVRDAIARFLVPANVHVEIDPDPVSLM